MESYVKLGLDVVTAIERVDKSVGLLADNAPVAIAPMPSAADNDAALAQLQQMMGGLK